jgi:hypothetical protein
MHDRDRRSGDRGSSTDTGASRWKQRQSQTQTHGFVREPDGVITSFAPPEEDSSNNRPPGGLGFVGDNLSHLLGAAEGA